MLPGRMPTLIDKFLSKLLIDFINNHAPRQPASQLGALGEILGVAYDILKMHVSDLESLKNCHLNNYRYMTKYIRTNLKFIDLQNSFISSHQILKLFEALNSKT